LKKERISRRKVTSFKGNSEQTVKMTRPSGRMVFGKNTVIELCRHRARWVKEVWTSHAGKDIVDEIKNKNIMVKLLPRETLDTISQGGNHQGLIGWFETPSYTLDELCEKVGEAGIILFAHGLQDPHNLGAAFRAAECFGVSGVVYAKNRGTEITPTVSKVAVGAAELVPSVVVPNGARALEQLKKQGFWSVLADLNESSTSLPSFNFPKKVVLVFGEEGGGAGRLMRESSDFVVSIPMQGVVDSLNVSQAVAVMLYEYRRQMAASYLCVE
jgi:23S rRNA (guanosine2251-2'-O)-methyltransferase